MMDNPYQDLPEAQFWSTGVAAKVREKAQFDIVSLLDFLTKDDVVISGGSCFAQYIGAELADRGYDYLQSKYSAERIESFGLGNIYTVAQLRQWIEFSLNRRRWSDDCVFNKQNKWQDLLLPHCDETESEALVHEHRNRVAEELVDYISKADVLVFTVGLTETWRSPSGEVYPMCPGTLRGQFNAGKHTFSNSTYTELAADLKLIEGMLGEVNQRLRMILTVSPVPLTATASGEHVLLATTYSKSVIRAAVGQHCKASEMATYFPSYELISHHALNDWRFEKNLRSVSHAGVDYVMSHAFGDEPIVRDAQQATEPTNKELASIDAACEEELLGSYAKLKVSGAVESDIVIIGDCHMEKLSNGFAKAGIDVLGGMVMHGSSFTDYHFEMCPDRIFVPTNSDESKEIWFKIHDRLKCLNGSCDIITNIGFQTHRTINIISNHCKKLILSEQDFADYFTHFYKSQICILHELTKLGRVWFVEDPNFYAFISDKDVSTTIRDRNFYQYSTFMRSLAREIGIEYLDPCNIALQQMFDDSLALEDIISPYGFLGTEKYYEYCAKAVAAKVGIESNSFALAA